MSTPDVAPGATTQDRVARSLMARYRAEWRFRLYGRFAVFLGLAFVVLLFGSIFSRGYTAFEQTYMRLDVTYDPEVIDPAGTRQPADLEQADYNALIKAALRAAQPDVEGRPALKQLYALASNSAGPDLEKRVLAHPDLIGHTETVWVLASDHVDQIVKGYIERKEPEESRGVTDAQIGWIDQLKAKGALKLRFNKRFFTAGD